MGFQWTDVVAVLGMIIMIYSCLPLIVYHFVHHFDLITILFTKHTVFPGLGNSSSGLWGKALSASRQLFALPEESKAEVAAGSGLTRNKGICQISDPLTSSNIC